MGAVKQTTHANDGIDPKLPAREDIEQEVISAFLFGHHESKLIFDLLNRDSFHNAFYARVFDAGKKQFDKGKPFDPVAISESMHKADLEAVGGLAGLATIASAMYARYDVEFACKTLGVKARQRELIHSLEKFQADAWNDKADARDLDDLFEAVLSSVAVIASKSTAATDDASDYGAGMEMLTKLEHYESTIRIMTGIADIDGAIGGFRPGELVVVTAETGTGKTLFASQIKRLACKRDFHCLFANGEMLASHLRAREVSVLSGVHYDKFRNPERLSHDDRAKILKTVGEGCQKCRIMEGDLTIARIRSATRKYHGKGEIAFLVVDYDELIEAPGNDEFAEQKEVVRGLKSLALELKIPIILISQLRKPVAKEDRSKPTLSRLYGSGSKVKTASIIIYVDRPFVQELQGDEAEARIIILKNRDGRTGSVPCMFNVRTLEFEDKPSFEAIRIP